MTRGGQAVRRSAGTWTGNTRLPEGELDAIDIARSGLDLAARVRSPTDRTVVYGHAYALPATRLYGGCRGK